MLIWKADLCCNHSTCQISRMWCALCIFEKQQCLLFSPNKGIMEGLFKWHKQQCCVEKQTFSDYHLSSYWMSSSCFKIQVLIGSIIKTSSSEADLHNHARQRIYERIPDPSLELQSRGLIQLAHQMAFLRSGAAASVLCSKSPNLWARTVAPFVPETTCLFLSLFILRLFFSCLWEVLLFLTEHSKADALTNTPKKIFWFKGWIVSEC